MIEEFSFGNFGSFKEIQTLNMTAAKIKSKEKSLDTNNLFQVNENLSLLKSKAIYGANASGKSNVVRALSAFIKIINYSVKDERSLSFIDTFRLSTETVSEPAFFQLIFRVGKTRYRYGFEADVKSIKSEWLFSTPNKREQPLFIREENEIIEMNQTHFEEGVLYQKLLKDSKDQIFTERSLFLTHLNSIGFAKQSQQIFKTITSILIVSGLTDKRMYDIAVESLSDEIQKDFILDFLKKADVGINDLKTIEITNDVLPNNLEEEVKQKLRKEKLIISSKTQFDSNLQVAGESDFSFVYQESEGTKKCLN